MQWILFNVAGILVGRMGDSVVGQEQKEEQMGEDIGLCKGLYLSGFSLLLIIFAEYDQECVQNNLDHVI